MLALTKKTDYALIALSCLAKQPGEHVSAREIAQSCGVPLPILTNILKTLASEGIVESTRGSSGGYGLARPVGSISLSELITTIEGPFQFVQCTLSDAENGTAVCELESSCPIRSPALKIYDRMKEFLDQVTLAELVEDPMLPGSGPVEEGSPALVDSDETKSTEFV